MPGMTSGVGYPLFSFSDRLAAIRHAGFESVMLWWGLGETETREERNLLARRHGLMIENVHADTSSLNSLWLDTEEYLVPLHELSQEIRDCGRFGIQTLVLHVTNGSVPPPVCSLGLERLGQLIRLAETEGVRLAFENMRVPHHTKAVLNSFSSPCVGFCYDSGHHHFWTPQEDWLSQYGSRLFAVHLHDNASDADSHLLPMDGTICWPRLIHQLALSSYQGTITLETEHLSPAGSPEESFHGCLNLAYRRALYLQQLFDSQRRVLLLKH